MALGQRAGHRRVVGQRDEPVVERAVERHERVEVLAGPGPADRDHRRRASSSSASTSAAASAWGTASAVSRGSRAARRSKTPSSSATVQLATRAPAVGDDLDQALGGEPRQRLADRACG